MYCFLDTLDILLDTFIRDLYKKEFSLFFLELKIWYKK